MFNDFYYSPEEVTHLLSGKLALKYVGQDLNAMKAIADSAQKRSLSDFQTAIKKFHTELQEDMVVKAHLTTLYDNMMEQNLCRIIEPYSKVQVSRYWQFGMLSSTHVDFKFYRFLLLGELHCKDYRITASPSRAETVSNDFGQEALRGAGPRPRSFGDL